MRLRTSCVVLVLSLFPALTLAQTPPAGGVAAPAPVEASPLPPPAAAPSPTTPAPAPVVPPAAPPSGPQAQSTPAAPASPAPAAPSQPEAPATAQPAPATPAAPASPAPAQTAGRATLFPNPGDPVNVDEGVLVAKPTAVLAGTSTWDDGFANLKAGFAKIEDELKKAGIAPAGRPLTVFVHTDDMGFRYEAMIPIPQAPEGRTELTPEVKFGKTPEGKSYRFVHKDAYEEIDGTYETITAYLDAKDIEAKDVFIEEYVTDLTDAQDTNLEINIYVQPKG